MKQKNVLVLPAVNTLPQVITNISKEYTFTPGSYRNIEIQFNNEDVTIFHSGIDINSFDAVWLSSRWDSRDIAFAISLYLKKNLVQHTIAESASSKVTDLMKFALAGLNIPNTWYSPKGDISCYINNIEEICKYPMVIKDTLGSKGKYSSFIISSEDLLSTKASLPETKQYIIQEYVPNDYEWGLLFANNKIVSAEKSYPKKGEYRNNACHGATELFVPINEIPSEVALLAQKAADILNLKWCRVDILVDKSTQVPYLLEVNRFPGITENSDEVSGAELYLEALLGA